VSQKEESSLPNIDECRYLILKIIEQAVRDYISLDGSDVLAEQALFATAEGFLFDDDYQIHWGDEEKTLCDLLDFLDIDIDWFRERVEIAKERKLKGFKIKRR